jgi:hypothetical protein
MQPATSTVNGVTRHRIQTSDDSEEVELFPGGGDPPGLLRVEKPPSFQYTGLPVPDRSALQKFEDRFLRRGKRQIGVFESLYNIGASSCRFTSLEFRLKRGGR